MTVYPYQLLPGDVILVGDGTWPERSGCLVLRAPGHPVGAVKVDVMLLEAGETDVLWCGHTERLEVWREGT